MNSVAWRKTLVLAAIAFVFSLSASQHAFAKWVQPVGAPLGPNTTTKLQPSMAAVGSTIFRADTERSGGQRSIVVRRLGPLDDQWVQVGDPLNFGTDTSAGSPVIATVGGSPYVAWQQQNQLTGVMSVYVKKLSQSPTPDTWLLVGTALNIDAARTASDPSIVDLAGIAHVGFVQSTTSNRQFRLVREGTLGWEPVGGEHNVNTAADATRPRIASDATGIHATWEEEFDGIRDAFAAHLPPADTTFAALAGPLTRPEGDSRGCRIANTSLGLVVGCQALVGGINKLIVKRWNALSSTWDQIGGDLNVTAGNGTRLAIAEIGSKLYALHVESVGGQNRAILSRYESGDDRWEVLPEFVGDGEAEFGELLSVAGTPWVGISEQNGAAYVYQLAPSVTDIETNVGADSAAANMYAETFGLPYDLSADLTSAVGSHPGSVVGTPPTLTATFQSLAPATSYELMIAATDPIGRRFEAGSSSFVTEQVEAPFDHEQPEVSLTYAAATRKAPTVSGNATDVDGTVSQVDVAVGLKRSGVCLWLSPPTFVVGDCDSPKWTRARGTNEFQLQLSKRIQKSLMRGAFEVHARAIDAAGNRSETAAYRCAKYRKLRTRNGRRVSRTTCSEWQ